MSQTTIQNVQVTIFEDGEVYPAGWSHPIGTSIAAAESYILERIQALKDEAIEAGDYAQAALCEQALSGDEEAVEACLKALAYAEAR